MIRSNEPESKQNSSFPHRTLVSIHSAHSNGSDERYKQEREHELPPEYPEKHRASFSCFASHLIIGGPCFCITLDELNRPSGTTAERRPIREDALVVGWRCFVTLAMLLQAGMAGRQVLVSPQLTFVAFGRIRSERSIACRKLASQVDREEQCQKSV